MRRKTMSKKDDDLTYTPPLPEGDDTDKKDKKDKKDKEKSTYDVDPSDPNYVEPRLRPDWTPDQPG
jgi:hypothetical protein